MEFIIHNSQFIIILGEPPYLRKKMRRPAVRLCRGALRSRPDEKIVTSSFQSPPLPSFSQKKVNFNEQLQLGNYLQL